MSPFGDPGPKVGRPPKPSPVSRKPLLLADNPPDGTVEVGNFAARDLDEPRMSLRQIRVRDLPSRSARAEN